MNHTEPDIAHDSTNDVSEITSQQCNISNEVLDKYADLDNGVAKADLASKRPLLVGAVSTISAALLAAYFNDIKATAMLIAAASTGVFIGLDYYKGLDKPHWSLCARVLTLLAGLIVAVTYLYD